MTEPVLSVKNISVVKGGRAVLRVPTLSVARGEFIAVTGPNGAGKSTLLKALALLETPVAGEISLNGQPVRNSQDRLKARRRTAMVFQDPLLLRGKVLDNVGLGLKLRGVPKGARIEKSGKWLTKLNIAHLADRDVRTLSGGEAQRVSLARAMVLEPDVLFLDEPFTYLDTPTRAALVGELKEILAEAGTTAIMVTHDLNDIPYLADRMIVMMQGVIEQEGPVREVLDRPRNRDVAGFLGVENIWPGLLVPCDNSYGIFTAEDGVPLLVMAPGTGRGGERDNPKQAAAAGNTMGNRRVTACIRPEHIMVMPPATSGTDRCADRTAGILPEISRLNTLEGRIKAVFPYGYYYRIKVIAGFAMTVLVPAVNFRQTPKCGDKLCLFLPPEKIHVMAVS